MKCYNHHDRDAFAVCKSCGKALCLECAEEYKNTLTYEKNDDYFTDVFIDYIIWPEELLTQEIFRIVRCMEI